VPRQFGERAAFESVDVNVRGEFFGESELVWSGLGGEGCTVG
jgi:hypothetical protein